MPGKSVKIRATEGGAFDCYLVTPAGGDEAPAVVLACSIDGVDADLRQIADEFAAAGYVAAAPDLFWRTVPGPLASGDTRAHERSQPRLEKITTNERDMVDTLAFLRTLPQCNGRAATMGFCYGGPSPFSGRSGSATTPVSPVTARRCSTTSASSTASRRRSASSGATRITVRRAGAGRLSCCGFAHEQRRGAHFSGRPARLHDAEQPRGVRRQNARLRHGAGLRDPRWASWLRGRQDAHRRPSPTA